MFKIQVAKIIQNHKYGIGIYSFLGEENLKILVFPNISDTETIRLTLKMKSY